MACGSSMRMSRWGFLEARACCRSFSNSQERFGSPEKIEEQRGTQQQVCRAFKHRNPSQALCISSSSDGISRRGNFGHVGREACEL